MNSHRNASESKNTGIYEGKSVNGDIIEKIFWLKS